MGFFRLTGMTRPLPIRVNAVQLAGEVVPAGLDDLWLLNEREEEKWMLGSSTDPMPTEPNRAEQDADIGPLGTRICDCECAPGEECCCPVC